MKLKYKLLLIFSLIIFIFFIWFFSQTPSNDRNWNSDQQLLSWAELTASNNSQINVYNIRNISYSSTTDFNVSYYNKTFDLNNLNSVYFMVEPFAQWQGAAHTFLSFGFQNENLGDDIEDDLEDEYLVISVEIRKEVGEHFSSVKGLLRQYELMYVFGDENDLIKLRSNYRNDSVYLYPIKAEKQKIKLLFLDMVERTNNIKQNPEFYNTLTSSCTTNIVDHVNKISPKKIPFDFRILAPGYSGKLAYEVGLIDTNLPWEQAQQHFKINKNALIYANDPNFSKKIRE